MGPQDPHDFGNTNINNTLVVPSYNMNISLVCPHLEYASPVWNPYLQKNTSTLEDVQKCALSAPSTGTTPTPSYSSYIATFLLCQNMHRFYLIDLCTTFEIVHGLFEFPPGILNTYYGRTPSTDRPPLFHRPFTCTNYYYNSFVSRTIPTWNSLPFTLVFNNLPFFKSHVWMHILH